MSSLRSLLCCCCEGSSTADDSPFERAVGLSRQPHSRSGALTVSLPLNFEPAAASGGALKLTATGTAFFGGTC